MSFSSRIKSTKSILKEETHRSNSHSTKILMNLKAPAIKINDSLTENKTCKRHLSHFIYGTLTFTSKLCPLCAVEGNCFISNLTKQSIAVEAGTRFL